MSSTKPSWRRYFQQPRRENIDFPVGLDEPVPINEQASINVVLIHDVTSGRDGAWSRQSPKNDVWSDFLAKVVPRARILTFGYDASSMTELSHMLDPKLIEKHAGELLDSLRERLGEHESTTSERDVENLRKESLLPLIVVAHGYGGLVYERALLTESPPGGNFLANRLQLALLLSTPHYDAGLGEWAIMCAKWRNIRCADNAQSQNWTDDVKEFVATTRKAQQELRKILKEQDKSSPVIKIAGCFASLPAPGSKLMMSPEWAVMPEFTPIPISDNYFGLTNLHPADRGSEKITTVLNSWQANIQGPKIPEYTSIGKHQHPVTESPKLTPLDVPSRVEEDDEQAEMLDQGVEELSSPVLQSRAMELAGMLRGRTAGGKRYALLVGIDCYLGNNGTRKFTDGEEVFLPHLKGCLNDARTLESLLQRKYHMSPNDITLLSSSLPDTGAEGDQRNLEPIEWSSPKRLPTFDNIKREFESVRDKTIAGDFFFFHFSGHGARIPRVHGSPLVQEKEPSLITFDYCRGKRAVRGWELNKWLKDLVKKGVRVVVSLDSCYSEEAWRAGEDDLGYRTPENWGSRSVVNLESDEDERSNESESRADEYETSWSLNPENFILMTACSVDQKAAERFHNNKVGGYFTNALFGYLERKEYGVRYRTVFEHLQQVLNPQKPQIYGRVGLFFFGNLEPFSVTSLEARIQDERLQIPAGRAHGVNLGSEFAPFFSVPDTTETIRVDNVANFTCSAPLSSEATRVLRQHNSTIVPSRWYFGENSVLRVVLDRSFHRLDPVRGLDKALLMALGSYIASDVEIMRTPFYDLDAPLEDGDFEFVLKCDFDDRIKIRGPKTLIGYSDPVRTLEISASDDWDEFATALARPLLHLCRFGHTLSLKSADSLSYNVSLLPAPPGTSESGSYSQNQGFTYIFENTDQQDLFFVILSLSPEFGIRQIFPSTDSQRRVTAGGRFQLSLRFKVPEAPAEIEILLHRTSWRETIRTIVTTRDGVSWRMLELPNIWEANMVEMTQPLEQTMGVLDAGEASEWSVFDNQIWLDA